MSLFSFYIIGINILYIGGKITKNYFKVKEVPTWNGGLTLKTYVTGTGQQLIYDLVVKDYERFLQSKKAV